MAGNEEEIDMNDDHDGHDTSGLPARADVQSTKRSLGETARTTQKKKESIKSRGRPARQGHGVL